MFLSLGSCGVGALAGCGVGALYGRGSLSEWWPKSCRGRARRKGAQPQLARSTTDQSRKGAKTQPGQSPSASTPGGKAASLDRPIERHASLRDRLMRSLLNAAAQDPVEVAHAPGLEYGAELVNDVVAKKWPYISEWFGDLLHEMVGPMIKSRCRGHAELTTCHLGTIPGFATSVVSTAFLEEWPGELDQERSSIRFIAKFRYSGDGIIGVQTTAGRVEFSPKMSGVLVVELVKQTRSIPWFTGFRVYFPDQPDLQFEDFKRPGFLDTAAYMFTGTGLDELVLECVKEEIRRRFVLPNCFAFPILPTEELDPVLLQNLRPRGVLRVSMQGSRQVQNPTAELSWTEYLFMGKPEPASQVPVQVRIGAHSAVLHPGDAHDFVLTQGSWKHIYIALHDKPEAASTVDLDQILLDRGPENAFTFSLPIPRAGSAFGFRRKHLRAAWRPFTGQVDAEVQDALFLAAAGVGEADDGAWVLVVDLCHVVGLPSSHSGVTHWARIQVLGSEQTSAGAVAAAPRQHGREILRDVYRMPQSVVDEIDQSGLELGSWHRMLSRQGLGEADLCGESVDAFWDQSVSVVLRRDMPADILTGDYGVAVQLWQSGSAASDGGEDSPQMWIAQATYPLQRLLDLEGCRTVLTLHMEAGPDAGSELGAFLKQGCLKVGLQLCPLKRDASQSQEQRMWGTASS